MRVGRSHNLLLTHANPTQRQFSLLPENARIKEGAPGIGMPLAAASRARALVAQMDRAEVS